MSNDGRLSRSGNNAHMVSNGATGERQGPEDPERFVFRDGKAVPAPDLPLAEFCQQYRLNGTLRDKLIEAGFETAGGLLEISEDNLQTAGLKIGEIGELRRALRELISKEILRGTEEVL
ncbi:hypothetical protein FB451DRAFT_1374665 [Mycena latifolia]|nr:hypothetical protein FB451DRAFT_1374665 [Mycena latifolia]